MAMPTRRTIFETGASNIKRSRSVVNLSHANTLTMNAGKLYPILAYSDVLPEDTHSLGMSLVLRSTTPVAPIMWDAYLQCEFYWVPNKLVLHRTSMTPSLVDSSYSWVAFTGAQDNLLNVGIPQENKLPSLGFNGSSTTGAVYNKGLASYLDYPYLTGLYNYGSGATEISFNPFALLAFFKVWSDYYRDPWLWNPVTYSISGTFPVFQFTSNANAGIGGGSFVTNIYTLDFPDVCREHGYFGSALPQPQRNSTGVMLGLGQNAPVIAVGTNVHDMGDDLLFGNATAATGVGVKTLGVYTASAGPTFGTVSYDPAGYNALGGYKSVSSSNLFADLSNTPGLSINSFRYAMALQGYYEALARYGNRYDDILRLYGVEVSKLPDDCVEYLGGKRIPITATQVVNMAKSSGADLGQVGGMINVSDKAHYFTKSMGDFGTIIGVAFIRFPETRYNFLSKERSRVDRMEYWNPYFANIGEVEVKKSEQWIPCDPNASGWSSGTALADIVKSQLTGTAVNFKSTNNSFGFMEYGADYRYHENCIHGEIHPVFGSLPGWTLLTNWDDIFGNSASPTGDPIQYFGLGAYLDADTQIQAWDDVLAVPSSTAGFQFILQVYFDWKAVRQVRQHSIPALLGHA